MANTLSVAGPNSKYKLEGASSAGFLGGLWHGMIAPITFIICRGPEVFPSKNELGP